METNQRPSFLTILCILSFIGIGFTFIGIFIGAFTTPSMEEIYESQEMMEDMVDSDSFLGQIFSASVDQQILIAENKIVYFGINILGAILCLFGVLKMWNLKKAGYIPYTIGNLMPPVLMTILGGVSLTALGGFLFPILFIVLYGLNTKHMS